MKNNVRIEQLTFIRFIAAIIVVIYHFGRNTFPFNNYFLYRIVKQGDLGVSFFFFLSGFVMIIAYHNKTRINFLHFIKNRFARIYPILFFAALLMLFNKFLNGNSYLNIKGLFLHLSLLHAWIPHYQLSFNTASWTLSVELFFYILFPFLFNHVYSKKNLNMKNISIFIISIWIITQMVLIILRPHMFLNFDGQTFIYNELIRFFPLMHLNQFLIGNLFGLLFIKYGCNSIKNYDYHILIMIFCLILLLEFNLDLNLFGGLILIVFAPLVYLISCNNGKLTTLSNTKALVFLGEISYGVYILQYPIFYIINYLFDKFNLNYDYNNLRFYLAFSILILFSSLSYLYFETPMRLLIKNFRITKHKIIIKNKSL